MKSFLTTTNSTDIISLNFNSSDLKIKLLTLEILEEICQIPDIGQG